MNWKLMLCVIFLSAGSPAWLFAQDKKPQKSVSVSFPGKSWAIEIDTPGFSVTKVEQQADGREYLLANNAATGVELSITLEESKGGADASTCPDYLKQRLQAVSQFGLKDVKSSVVDSMAVLEFLIPTVQSVPVQQKNFIACIAHDDVYIDVHLSKASFQPKDESLFPAILKQVHFTDARNANTTDSSEKDDNSQSGTASTSTDYFEQGSRYFLRQDFKNAVGPYQKALDLEKKQPQLTKNLWRVLIDNLSIAFGITGDLGRAEETLNFGVSKDSEYPMFYYNLACVYADRHDMDKTMNFLGKAFALKANSIPGESVPDPRKDDSFQEFMSDERFRNFLDSLVTSAN